MIERNLKKHLTNELRTHHLLSVAQILSDLKNEGKAYNKTSVYRALEQLEEENVVCRHYFNDAQALYELSQDHHTHLLCKNCGKIALAGCNYMQPSIIGEFEVDHHHLTLVGICADCKHTQAI